MNPIIKHRIETSGHFLKVVASKKGTERTYILLDKGIGVAYSDNVRYDALMLAGEYNFRSNVYLEEITEIVGRVEENEVVAMMRKAR